MLSISCECVYCSCDSMLADSEYAYINETMERKDNKSSLAQPGYHAVYPYLLSNHWKRSTQTQHCLATNKYCSATTLVMLVANFGVSKLKYFDTSAHS